MKTVLCLGAWLMLFGCGVKASPLPPLPVTPQESDRQETAVSEKAMAVPSPVPGR